MTDLSELRDLIDFPRETQACEYKSWLDLTTPPHKADLARHLAAIANFGGGYIVFGFNDLDLSPIADGADWSLLTHDVVGGIIDKYLAPSFQCSVERVTSETGSIHPVILVPGHGATPVCAKQNGPEDNKGKIVGIRAGTYYIRKPGPKSEPITAPEDWSPVIRRCAMHERTVIMGAVAAALRISDGGPSGPASSRLDIWNAAAEATYIAKIQALPEKELLSRSRQQFGYRIEGRGLEPYPVTYLLQEIGRINNEVKDRINTGWSMFYPFTDHVLWNADEQSGTDEDFLECSIVDGDTHRVAGDFWRISPEGLVTLIREYWEDRSFYKERYGTEPGSVIDPFLTMRSVTELVRHAAAFAERFSAAESVSFSCTWNGLSGRRPYDMRDYQRAVGHASQRENRTVKHVVSVADLTAQWPVVVAALVAPLGRSLGLVEYFSADRIAAQAERMRRL